MNKKYFLFILILISSVSFLNCTGKKNKGIRIPQQTPPIIIPPSNCNADDSCTVDDRHKPVFKHKNYSFIMPEDKAVDSIVGMVEATDQDEEEITSYSITEGNTGDAFSINDIGEITVKNPLDHSIRSIYNLVVKASNSDDAFVRVTITLINKDTSAPEFSENRYTFSIDENNISNNIGTVSATSSGGGSITYSISSGDTISFTISPDGGILSVLRPLDHEENGTHDLVVTAVDSKGIQNNALVTILINDIDEPPLFEKAGYSFLIPEDQAVDSIIGMVQAIDPEGEDITSYSITEGNTGDAFSIDDDGEITVKKPLDYAIKSIYNLMVKASNSKNSSIHVTITLINKDTSAPVFSQTSYTFSIDENNTSNDIGTVSATDDGGGRVTYLIATGGGSFFSVNADGMISVLSPLDHEQRESHDLIITASDSVGLSSNANVVISVNDIDEAPFFTKTEYGFNIPEDKAVSTSIGIVAASDPDERDSIDHYMIKTGNVGNAFAIDSAGHITVNNPLDYETTDQYTLSLEATSNTKTATTTIKIMIINKNDLAPVFSQPGGYRFSILENTSSPANVGSVSATDPDTGSLIDMYSITSGDKSLFSIDRSGNIVILRPLDYESIPDRHHDLIITATDMDSDTNTVSVTVSLMNVDEAPVFTETEYIFSISETSPIDSLAGSIRANDPDESETIASYSITSGNTGDAFSIDINGRITVKKVLNFSTDPVYDMMFTASNTKNASVRVLIILLNENILAPVFSPLSYTFSVNENAAPPTPIGTVSATDPDTGSAIEMYSIASGDSTLFQIDRMSGEISTLSSLNYESIDRYNLVIEAMDPDMDINNAAVSIRVVDVNDPPVFSKSMYTFDFEEGTGRVGKVIADDPDGDPIAYSITEVIGGDIALFSIDPGGFITGSDILDDDIRSDYTVTVSGSDGTLSSSVIVNVTITTSADTDGDGKDDREDNCPDVANAIQTDTDIDGIGDSCDVDDDNDGLIEIHTLDGLNNMRYDLDGSHYDDDGIGEETTVLETDGDSHGCASGGCNGYELTRDLDFTKADSYASGIVNDDWLPEGGDPEKATNDGFIPIGRGTSFIATLEGNGFNIINLYVNHQRDISNTGLIGALGNGGIIHDLGVVDNTVRGSHYSTGGLVGYNIGSISHSHSTGNVSGGMRVGGLAGNNDGSIDHSYFIGNVSFGGIVGGIVGGLVGYNQLGSISNSHSSGNVSGIEEVGGLVGGNYRGNIHHSHSTGNVSGIEEVGGLVGINLTGSIINASYATGDVSGIEEVGGLVGINLTGSIINASYATGDVSGRKVVGGLIGFNSSIVAGSYSTGDVFGKGDQIGGLAGSHAGSLVTSYSTGNVFAGLESMGIGGLIGYMMYIPGIINSNLEASYASGKVYGRITTTGVGGLLGYAGYNLVIFPDSTTSYWDKNDRVLFDQNIRGHLVGFGKYYDNLSGFGLTTMQMKSTTGTYPDFGAYSNAWNLVDGRYPELKTWMNAGPDGKTGTPDDHYSDDLLGGPNRNDGDNDSISDAMDNCPSTHNTDQKDNDGDSMGDACDDDDDNDGSMDINDVDDDNDGLIDIYTLEDLNNIRYDLSGTSYDDEQDDGPGNEGDITGAPTSPTADCDTPIRGIYLCGYELKRHLNFAYPGSYASGSTNDEWRPNNLNITIESTLRAWGFRVSSANGNPKAATNAGWQPIAHDTDATEKGFNGTPFGCILEGNGLTISNLYVNLGSNLYGGLIGNMNENGVIRNIVLLSNTVRGGDIIGGLIGNISSGMVFNSHVTGDVFGNNFSGGLAGRNDGGTLFSSYSSGTVSGTGTSSTSIGGLLGINTNQSLAGRPAMLSTSYSNATVSGRFATGGLVGLNYFSSIHSSYSAGQVTSNQNGGAVGAFSGSSTLGSIDATYWDKDMVPGSLSHGDIGLSTEQMKSTSGVYPDFMEFSNAWFLENGQYPRLRLWMDSGIDGIPGTSDDNYHPDKLLGE